MRTTATVTLAAALLALTACSSSDGDSGPRETSTAATKPAPDGAAELKQAVRAYTDAYFAGDADTAYAALSKRCREKISAAEYEAVVKQANTEYGTGHGATDVQADVSGSLARVTYKVQGLPKFDQESQPWAREGGDWKYDAC